MEGKSLQQNGSVCPRIVWEQPELLTKGTLTECYPLPRDGHSAAVVGSAFYVFGGVVQQEDVGIESNELLKLYTDTWQWEKVVAKGDLPTSRSSGAMVAVGDKLYLFGGLNQMDGWLSGIHVFDTNANLWLRVDGLGREPSPRDKISAAVIGKKIYIFGGFGPQDIADEEDGDSDEESLLPDDQEAARFGWFNDLFIYDTESNSWSQPLQLNSAAPTPRAAAAMCAVGRCLFIFGGRDAEGRRNDTYIFDTDTRKWLALPAQISNHAPPPRSFHTATALDQGRAIVFGGRGVADQHYSDLYLFDREKFDWVELGASKGDQAPCGRGVHTATSIGDKLVVFGGSSDFDSESMQCRRYHNDVYFFRTGQILQATATSEVKCNGNSTMQQCGSEKSENSPKKRVADTNVDTVEEDSKRLREQDVYVNI